jgi:hypothetical protein
MRHELAPRLVDRYRRLFREKRKVLTEACLQAAISPSEDCQDCASTATVPTAISNVSIRPRFNALHSRSTVREFP